MTETLNAKALLKNNIAVPKVAKQASFLQNLLWTSGGSMLTRLLFLMSSMFTARLLSPEDFGIIGMAATITMFIDTSSANGIDNFIIQQHDTVQDDLGTAFILNTLITVILTVLMLLLAPTAAAFYHKTQLVYVIILGAAYFFMSSISKIHRGLLLKNMQQDIFSKIDIVSNFINFIGILFFAFSGFKYLSYIYALLIAQTGKTIALFCIVQFKTKLSFSMESAKRILTYSKSFLPQYLLSYFLSQTDYIIAGVLLGSKILGLYYFGFEKAFIILFFIQSITRPVFFPVFSKLQQDPEALKRKYFEFASYFMGLLFPVLLILLVCADEVFGFLYGSQWNNSILTFKLLLCYCFFSIMHELTITLFNATGHPVQNLKHYLLITPVSIVLFWIGTANFGIQGLSIAAFIVHTSSAILLFIRANRFFHWPIYSQLSSIFKHLLPILVLLPLLLVLENRLYSAKQQPLIIILASGLLCLTGYSILLKFMHPAFFDLLYHKFQRKR
jgi:lipopolysaccharide exporter